MRTNIIYAVLAVLIIGAVCVGTSKAETLKLTDPSVTTVPDGATEAIKSNATWSGTPGFAVRSSAAGKAVTVSLANVTTTGPYQVIANWTDGTKRNYVWDYDARMAYLDAAVSSRLATSGYTAPDNAGIAAIPTNPLLTTDTRLNHLDADISTRSTFSGGAVASVTAPVTVGTNNDKTGYALTSAYDPAKTAAQAATALSSSTWTSGRASNLDYLDALISSRLATSGYTAPDNAGINSARATLNLISSITTRIKVRPYSP